MQIAPAVVQIRSVDECTVAYAVRRVCDDRQNFRMGRRVAIAPRPVAGLCHNLATRIDQYRPHRHLAGRFGLDVRGFQVGKAVMLGILLVLGVPALRG